MPEWSVVLKKFAIWGVFLACIYLARDFFFTGFMTFIFCYATLSIVDWAMKRLSPLEDRTWLRRLLTVSVFVVALFALFAAGWLILPTLVSQGQRIAGWLSNTDPQTEAARVMEGFIGPFEFRQKYGNEHSPEYQKDFAEFRATGDHHAHEYHDFERLEAWLEGGFTRQFMDTERARIRQELLREGTRSADFEKWYLHEKYPALQNAARKSASADNPSSSQNEILPPGDSANARDLLAKIQKDPVQLTALRDEWIQVALKRKLDDMKSSPSYQQHFKEFYEEERKAKPDLTPYTFEQYVELQSARAQGLHAFSDAYERLVPSSRESSESQMKADFESAKKHELFRNWWDNSTPGHMIHRQLESGMGDGNALVGKAESVLSDFFDVPISLMTALLLSFFICIDYSTLKRGVGRLRETWAREIYDEIVPALIRMGQLVALSLKAQGLIALCNATMIFIALSIIGVAHVAFLSMLVFVLCLVPTLGAVIACVIIATFAMLQPGGGLVLAMKVVVAFFVVGFMESFVLSPRILGRMMELHPVLIIALLPVTQYFFGIWGVILATPMAVYVIHVLILGRHPDGDKPPSAVAGKSK